MPAQVNRSAFTSRRKVVGLPGAEIWTAKATVESLATELDEREWRAFMMKMRGVENVCDVPVMQFQIDTTPYSLMLNVNNTAVSGSTVTKSGGGAAWNASARSTAAYSDSVEVSYEVTANTSVGVGLDTNPTASSDFAVVSYWIFQDNIQTIQIYRNGVLVGRFGRWKLGDRLAVRRSAGIVYYLRNGLEIYSHPVDAPNEALYGVANIFSVGAQVAKVAFAQLPQVATGSSNSYAALVENTPPLAMPFMHEGQFATFLLPSGHRRLVTLSADNFPGSGGLCNFSVEPALGEVPITASTVELVRPFSRMNFVDRRQGWRTSGGVTSIVLDFEEAL
ncbi:MAG: hypothetical protein V4530_06080 [Pseudomonadota bacterium]